MENCDEHGYLINDFILDIIWYGRQCPIFNPVQSQLMFWFYNPPGWACYFYTDT